MKDDTSIMPILYGFIQDGGHHTFDKYTQKFPVICDDKGVPLIDSKIKIQNTFTSSGMEYIHDMYNMELDKRFAWDDEIISLAKEYAIRYKVPDQSKIHTRDQINHHAIIRQNRFISQITQKTMHSGWASTNRKIIESYLSRIGSKNDLLLDISLHDYTGRQMNTEQWTHSILGFSSDASDDHNVLLPDLYAMQYYRGMLDPNKRDNLPTIKKTNKLLFIGTSSGKACTKTNQRIQICRFAHNKKNEGYIEAYISSVSNFSAKQAKEFKEYMHGHMSIEEQHTYRHIMVVDGNTACWDRMPWVLSSKCVCWKMESTDQCWYYPLLKPWVHYIPFTLENLEDTWHRVKDDIQLQLNIVKNANCFAERYLSPHAHALYTKTLLDTIAEINKDKVDIASKKEYTITEIKSLTALEREYDRVSSTISDFIQNIVFIHDYAVKCVNILQLGMKDGTCTWALLKGLSDNTSNENKWMITCDKKSYPIVKKIQDISKEEKISFTFFEKNNLDIDIINNDYLKNGVDMIFINTWHVYGQLKRELEIYSRIVKKYIVIHGTDSYGEYGEAIEEHQNILKRSENSGIPVNEIVKGVKFAIDEFLENNKNEWVIDIIRSCGQGVTVLRNNRI
jgi:uncharacterized protein (UPF0305 family)